MNHPPASGGRRRDADARPTVIDVLERFVADYWIRHGERVTLEQRKALQAILQCRTPQLGGQCYHCGDCAHTHFAYHSCNHRLCPRCGAADTAEWVGAQLQRLLPVPYFLVTFTLPQQLRPLLYGCHKAIEAFFRTSGQALQEILADPRRTGFAKNGFFGVFQSWDQRMGFHPHIHYVVPAVGLNPKGKLRRLKQAKFLVYAQVLADRLRTLLLAKFEEQGLIAPTLRGQLRQIKWNADVAPAGRGENAVKYLGQYVHHSVISDHRILAIEGDQVRFRIKNRDTGEHQTVVLEGVEFLRRFLLHVLPAGFHRIRYRGFLHARAKPTLQWLQVLLDATIPAKQPPSPTAADNRICPHCGRPMRAGQRLARAPPLQRNHHFFQRLAA